MEIAIPPRDKVRTSQRWQLTRNSWERKEEYTRVEKISPFNRIATFWEKNKQRKASAQAGSKPITDESCSESPAQNNMGTLGQMTASDSGKTRWKLLYYTKPISLGIICITLLNSFMSSGYGDQQAKYIIYWSYDFPILLTIIGQRSVNWWCSKKNTCLMALLYQSSGKKMERVSIYSLNEGEIQSSAS